MGTLSDSMQQVIHEDDYQFGKIDIIAWLSIPLALPSLRLFGIFDWGVLPLACAVFMLFVAWYLHITE